MKPPDIERLVAWSRQRVVTPSQRQELEAWLRADAEARAVWQEEAALSQALRALPDAPLSPHFSHRVLAAVAPAAASARPAFSGWRLRWPAALRGWRLATAFGALLALAIAWPLHRQAATRAQWAESVAALSELDEWPDLAALVDFEVVYHLPSGPLPTETDLARAFE